METELTALLAGVAGGRRYWGRAPQSAARPYVVLFRIDGVASYSFSGRTNLTASRVQANCTGVTHTSARETADALIATIDGIATLPTGKIHAIFIESDGRSLTTEDAGGVTPLFVVAVDFTVHHEV